LHPLPPRSIARLDLRPSPRLIAPQVFSATTANQTPALHAPPAPSLPPPAHSPAPPALQPKSPLLLHRSANRAPQVHSPTRNRQPAPFVIWDITSRIPFVLPRAARFAP
jgi:hypothetical protein